MSELREAFPQPSKLPKELRSRLDEMISWLNKARLNALVLKEELPKYKDLDHMYQIKNEAGEIGCVFKQYKATPAQELYARKEALVYLLDHPLDGRRSESTSLYGYSGVRPCVFVKYDDAVGVLIEFVETMSIKEFMNEHFGEIQIDRDEIQKVSVLDIRFGNPDRSEENMLVQLEGEIPRIIPIDHEMSLTEGMGYSLSKPYWMYMDAGNETFSQESVDYVRNLNAPMDMDFAERCGWRPPDAYRESYGVLTGLLKRAVEVGLRPKQIVTIASLLSLRVLDIAHDGDYVRKVSEVVEELVQEEEEI